MAAAALTAGTEPRKTPAGYAAQAEAGHGVVAADYGGRAYAGEKGSFFTGSYLVFEVALYAEKGEAMELAPGDFRLRLNGGAREWTVATAGSVAAEVRNPGQFEPYRGVVAGGGVGQGGIVIGGPPTVERFPGDPQARGPRQPKAPGREGERAEEDPAQAVTECALERVQVDGSGASGLIYFYWRGKLKQLKRIELVYQGPAGKAVLRLR